MVALLVFLFKWLPKYGYMKRVGMGLVHYVFMIAVVLFLIVLCANFIGDGLRDALDPRARK